MEPTVDCGELMAQLGDDEVLILDCRSLEEWNGYGLHIPGALRMGVEEIGQFAHALPDDELIVLCGYRPDGSDARRAYRFLQFRGRRAVILAGGLRSWVTEGYPTESHPTAPARLVPGAGMGGQKSARA